MKRIVSWLLLPGRHFVIPTFGPGNAFGSFFSCLLLCNVYRVWFLDCTASVREERRQEQPTFLPESEAKRWTVLFDERTCRFHGCRRRSLFFRVALGFCVQVLSRLVVVVLPSGNTRPPPNERESPRRAMGCTGACGAGGGIRVDTRCADVVWARRRGRGASVPRFELSRNPMRCTSEGRCGRHVFFSGVTTVGMAVRDESSGRPSARAMDGSAESPVFDSEHLPTPTSFRWRSVGDLFGCFSFVREMQPRTSPVLVFETHMRRSPDRKGMVFLFNGSNDRCLSDRGSLKTSGRSVSFRKASWQGTRWNVVVFFSENTVRFVVRPSFPPGRGDRIERIQGWIVRRVTVAGIDERTDGLPRHPSTSSILRRKMKVLDFLVGKREAGH